MSPQVLPRITVQPSFLEVVQEIAQGTSHSAEDVWVSVYLDGSPSVHGKVRVMEGDERGQVELEARDGVEVERVSSTALRIACPALKIGPTPTLFPLATPFSLRGGIDTFDVSPNGELVVIGGKDGGVRVVDAGGNRRAVDLNGHVGDVRDAVFFPSGEVVLTCSSDMRVRVFSALDGSNPRTMVGHTKAVTSLAILGIGKAVASSSLDGSIRLWTVGDASTLSTIRFTQPITAMAVGIYPSASSDPSISFSPDVPPGAIAVVAHTNGSASLVSLSDATRDIRTLQAGSSPLYAVAFHPPTGLVAVGSRDGTISLFSLSTPTSPDVPDTPLQTFARSSASILSLQFCGDIPSLLVGSADGLPFRVSLGLQDGAGELVVVEEFAGLDCDPAVVKETAGWVWVAAGDGKLRRYGGTVREM